MERLAPNLEDAVEELVRSRAWKKSDIEEAATNPKAQQALAAVAATGMNRKDFYDLALLALEQWS